MSESRVEHLQPARGFFRPSIFYAPSAFVTIFDGLPITEIDSMPQGALVAIFDRLPIIKGSSQS